MKKLTCCIGVIVLLSGCQERTDEIKISHFKDRNPDYKRKEADTIQVSEYEKSSKITSDEAKNRIGDSVTVTGLIAAVHSGDKVTYLNFDKKFPLNEFSCAIFPDDVEQFGDINLYRNKKAEVTGKITKFRNKPQIILNSKDQLKILN